MTESNVQTTSLTASLGMRRQPEASPGSVQYQALCASQHPSLGLSQAEMLQAVDLAEALASLSDTSRALSEYLKKFASANADEGDNKRYVLSWRKLQPVQVNQ